MKKRVKNNKILEFITFIQIAFLILPLFVSTARADIFDVGNLGDFVDPFTKAITNSAVDVTQQALGQILEDLGLGDDAFEEMGETINTWENKKNAPEVRLMFNPSSPKVAESITATALPQYFQSTKENLYFTWYLKHDNTGGDDGKGNTDHNNDGDIDIEDYKIEAMREIAKGGFDKNKAKDSNDATIKDDDDGFGTLEDYAQSGIITDDACDSISISLDKPLPSSDCDGGTDVEEDIDDMCDNASDKPVEVCTKAPFGGTNNKQPTDGFRCYVKDYEDGILYEIVQSGQGGVCDKTGDPTNAEFEGANAGITIDPNDTEPALEELSEKFRDMGYQACPYKESFQWPTGSGNYYKDKMIINGAVRDVINTATGDWNVAEPPATLTGILNSHVTETTQECSESCGSRSTTNCPEIHHDKESDSSHPDFDPATDSSLYGLTELTPSLTATSGNHGEPSVEFDTGGALTMTWTDGNCNGTTWGEWYMYYVYDGKWTQYSGDGMLSWATGKLKRDFYLCDPELIPEDWVWAGCNEEKGVNCYFPPVGEELYFTLLGYTVNDPGCARTNDGRTGYAPYTWDWTYSGSNDNKGEPSICTHLFPHATYDEVTAAESDDDVDAGDIRFVTGDGKFTPEEEEFWETNPEDPDTAGDGIGDEAAIAGVGRDRFTWTYNKGDKVGVAVEGNSTNPTKHDDSSYMVMWALPNNNFDVKSTKCKIKNKGSYTKTINDRDVTIETAQADINACLEENLVDPLESPAGGAPAKNLEVDLSYSPAKPFNDSSEDEGYTSYTPDDSDDGTGDSVFTLCPGSPTMTNCTINETTTIAGSSCGRQTFTSNNNLEGRQTIRCTSDDGDTYNYVISEGAVGQKGSCRDAVTDPTCDPDSVASGNEGVGSNIIIQSILNNSDTNDSRDVYYKWTISGRNDTDFMEDSGWTDITGALDIGTTEGLNKDSINFNLNLTEETDAHQAIFAGGSQGYIRASLSVEENYGSGMTKSGKGEKIIKVTTGASNQINLYRAEYIGGDLTIDRNTQLCIPDQGNQNVNDPVCAFSENEIIAAELQTANTSLRNYAWTLNGESLECTSEISSECSDTVQGDTVFFPVLGEEGERYTLTVVGNDVEPGLQAGVRNTGETTEVNQIFQVVDPQVMLGPLGGYDIETCESEAGGFHGKLMGSYRDLKDRDNPITSCSTKVFITEGGTLNIQATFNPSFVGRHIKEIYEAKTTDEERDEVIVMSVNGERADINFADNGIIDATYEADDVVPGDSINVSISGTYAQSDIMKKALIVEFGVPQFELSDAKISNNIKIKVVEDAGNQEEAAFGKITNTMASLISNLPTQMLFLFRVMLTVATVIFISGTVFALGKQGV